MTIHSPLQLMRDPIDDLSYVTPLFHNPSSSLSDFRIRIFRIDFSFFTKSFDLCIMHKIIIVRVLTI